MRRPPKASGIIKIVSEADQSGKVQYSGHANERMRQRGFLKPEVEYVLKNGHHEPRKDTFNEKEMAWDYSIRGKTVDKRNLRIIVTVVSPGVFVVTTIDLHKEDESV